MKTLARAICVLLAFAFLAFDASAQRPRPARRIDDHPEAKNVYEVFARLKSVNPDASAFAVDIVQPPDIDKVVEVAIFKITGETIFRAIDEGKTLADYPPGTPLFIAYRTGTPDCKGTALLVRRIVRFVPPADDTK